MKYKLYGIINKLIAELEAYTNKGITRHNSDEIELIVTTIERLERLVRTFDDTTSMAAVLGARE